MDPHILFSAYVGETLHVTQMMLLPGTLDDVTRDGKTMEISNLWGFGRLSYLGYEGGK